MDSPPRTYIRRDIPPPIARVRMGRLRASLPNVLYIMDMRKSFDAGSQDYTNATEVIAKMLSSLREEGLICDCWNECTDIKNVDDTARRLFY